MYNGPNQTACNFLGSLLQQLALQNDAILEDIKSCYDRHDRYMTRPTINEIATLLRSQVEQFDQVFVMIDALDECPEADQIRKIFLAETRGLLPKVRLMITSRELQSIQSTFEMDTRIEIRAQEQDLRIFIESQVVQKDELADLLDGHEDVQSSIFATVLEKTSGMYILQPANGYISQLTRRKVPACSAAHGFSG